mmetsp:Transcript_55675/g.95892  ORF Transcript_55675/g.95892 Transcript_55675/m.95892 type:complete len:228 (+) Transcript_55675:171-854(+)
MCGSRARTWSGVAARMAFACARSVSGFMAWSILAAAASRSADNCASCCFSANSAGGTPSEPWAMSTARSSSGITCSSSNSSSCALPSPLVTSAPTPLAASAALASSSVSSSASLGSGCRLAGLRSMGFSSPSTSTFCLPFSFTALFTCPSLPLNCAAACSPWSTTLVPTGNPGTVLAEAAGKPLAAPPTIAPGCCPCIVRLISSIWPGDMFRSSSAAALIRAGSLAI